MPYTNTQIGPDGKRHPIGDPDPFVSGIALPAEDVPAEDVPAEDVPAEDVPAEDVPAEDGAPDYSDYEDDVEGED
jgi:hypothetical protein